MLDCISQHVQCDLSLVKNRKIMDRINPTLIKVRNWQTQLPNLLINQDNNVGFFLAGVSLKKEHFTPLAPKGTNLYSAGA